MAKKLEEMTDAEKLEWLDKYQEKRKARKGTSGAKRQAVKALREAHPEVVEKLESTVKVAVKAPKASNLTVEQKAKKWDDLQAKRASRTGKSALKRAVNSALIKQFPDEYEALKTGGGAPKKVTAKK